ncbi:MAG: ABC transporter ATP-binding protein [Bacilli bacterium]|nr:ABC transporter ATP-binding protein [Bacilli bacterium]
MKKKVNKGYIKKSIKFFKNVKYELLVIVLVYILLGIIGFITPIVEANLITSITNTVVNKVILIALGFLIIKTIEELLWHFGMSFWKKKVRTKILFNIRKELVDNVFELKLSNFDKYSTGTFQERIKNDPQTVARVVNAGQRYLTQCITKIGVIIYVVCINWVIGIIYICGVIMVSLIDNHVQEKSKEKNKITRESDEKVNSILSEIIRGIRDIKLLNFKNSVKNLIGNELDKNNENIVEKDTYDSLMNRVKRIVLFLTVLLVVVVGIRFVDVGMLKAADLIVLYLYYGNIFTLMDNFSSLRSCLKEYELAVERIFDLYDSNKYPKDNYGKINIKDFKGKICFEDVSFRYSKNKPVLENLSFTVDANDTVAIVGASGSGKTTIFNLITKSYDINSGKLSFDDIDINELSEETIRKNVSIITQSPYIFNMSIKDNLKLVKPNATQKEIDEVCRKACFYDYIMSLPDKYDTIIGEGGVNLSGGQKQRLAIARALLKTSKILLFDEATSALDNITQKEIQESIDNISKDYTIIIVAHRLSTIMNCNRIYMLNDGRIVDSGTHKELLKKNKEYKKLYNTESKGGDK